MPLRTVSRVKSYSVLLSTLVSGDHLTDRIIPRKLLSWHSTLSPYYLQAREVDLGSYLVLSKVDPELLKPSYRGHVPVYDAPRMFVTRRIPGGPNQGV